MQLVIDIETERLEDPQKIWLIATLDIDTKEERIFLEPQKDPTEFIEYTKEVDKYIGHNIISFDIPVINQLLGLTIGGDKLIDTLVLSRLFNYKLAEGHSLEAWGERLGELKYSFSDFSALSEAMIKYCQQDVNVNFKLYLHFLPYLLSSQWEQAIRLELDTAILCQQMSANGFYYDYLSSVSLLDRIKGEIKELDKAILKGFPPKAKPIREITPSLTKFGTLHKKDFKWKTDGDLSGFSAGSPFTLFEWESFNPSSPKQVVERLNKIGWKPFEKTKGHIEAEKAGDEEALQKYRVYGWKVNEANLSTLPESAPEGARKLAERLSLDSRRGDLEEWQTAFCEADNRIHGQFLPIGAWTGRMAHRRPNTANIASGGKYYADRLRQLWTVPEGRLLLGCDAEGIQLRILAHYINDILFTNAIVSGNKLDGTDAHSLNQRALGPICKSRDDAKTFIYAWLLGAGIGKIAQILGCSLEEAREAVNNFLDAYPGLRILKETVIKRDAERGYFEGIDGRLVIVPFEEPRQRERYMLSGYLQNGESVIMKSAGVSWTKELTCQRVNYLLVNFVHDEWQTELDNDLDLCNYVGQLQAQSITQAGLRYNLRCPLSGNYVIGKNWAESH